MYATNAAVTTTTTVTGPTSGVLAVPPPPIPVGCTLGSPVTGTVAAGKVFALSLNSAGAKATLTAHVGALTGGTRVSLWPVVEGAGLVIDLATGQHYLVSFAVNWDWSGRRCRGRQGAAPPCGCRPIGAPG